MTTLQHIPLHCWTSPDLPGHAVQGALGVTGTAGTFSGSCEKVLRELRGNVPLLTDLVAAFVTDPLVEWSFVKDDHAASKVRPMIPTPE